MIFFQNPDKMAEIKSVEYGLDSIKKAAKSQATFNIFFIHSGINVVATK